MAHADRITDLQPCAGHDGGRIVIEVRSANLGAAGCMPACEHLAAFAGRLEGR